VCRLASFNPVEGVFMRKATALQLAAYWFVVLDGTNKLCGGNLNWCDFPGGF